MSKARYFDDQMVKIIREADKAPVSEVAKRHGVSEAMTYAWRKKLRRPRVSLAVPMRVNERWSVDFVSDQLADGC